MDQHTLLKIICGTTQCQRDTSYWDVIFVAFFHIFVRQCAKCQKLFLQQNCSFLPKECCSFWFVATTSGMICSDKITPNYFKSNFNKIVTVILWSVDSQSHEVYEILCRNGCWEVSQPRALLKWSKSNIFWNCILDSKHKVWKFHIMYSVGIKEQFLRWINDCGAVRYRNKIKFRIFFCLMNLNYLAWFDLNKGSKIYFNNLFFCFLKSTINNSEQKN